MESKGLGTASGARRRRPLHESNAKAPKQIEANESVAKEDIVIAVTVRTVAIALTVGVMFAGLGPAFAGEEAPRPKSVLEQILARGEIRVGLEAGYIPFEMINKAGQLVGFDVDMARAMARALGVKLKLVNTTWGGIIPAVLEGRIDIIMSGMTITAKRNLKINFSDPYIVVGQTLLVRKSLAPKIESYKSLNQPAYIIATKRDVTAHTATEIYMPKAKLKLFDTEVAALQEVLDGKAHAFVYDFPLAAIYHVRHKDKLAFIERPFTHERLGWGVRKGDPDTLNWLNHFLDQVKGDGTYGKIYDKWFNNNDWIQDLP